MDLTWIVPVPEPVMAGGRAYLATCFQLRDLACLQAWLKARVPCPLEAARGPIADAEGSGRRRLLRETWEACEGWPVPLGSLGAWGLLAAGEGLRCFLGALLAKWNPGFDDAAAGELASRLTAAEHAGLSRVAFAAHPLDELARLIDPESTARPGDTVNWGAVACELIEETGWSFGQVGDLYLSQLIAWRSRGRPGWGEVPLAPGRSLAQEARRRRAMFYGEDGE